MYHTIPSLLALMATSHLPEWYALIQAGGSSIPSISMSLPRPVGLLTSACAHPRVSPNRS